MLDTKFWKKYFREYDVLNNLIPYDLLLNTIVDKIKIKSKDLVLDVGSGTGNLSMRLEKIGATVTAIDYSFEGIEIHKSKNPKASIIQHDITLKLPFSDNFFDKIVSNNVLYTIDSKKRNFVFSEFYRVLKPGGLIVISNLSENFKPINIYRKHIKEYKKQNGVIKTFLHLVSLVLPTIKIFYYNYLISKENSNGLYSFFKKDEQKDYLLMAGFSSVSDTELHYANQAVLNVAIK